MASRRGSRPSISSAPRVPSPSGHVRRRCGAPRCRRRSPCPPGPDAAPTRDRRVVGPVGVDEDGGRMGPTAWAACPAQRRREPPRGRPDRPVCGMPSPRRRASVRVRVVTTRPSPPTALPATRCCSRRAPDLQHPTGPRDPRQEVENLPRWATRRCRAGRPGLGGPDEVEIGRVVGDGAGQVFVGAGPALCPPHRRYANSVVLVQRR